MNPEPVRLKALVITRDRNGEPVKTGSLVGLTPDDLGYIVGEDGSVRRVRMVERTGDGGRCVPLSRKGKARRKADKRAAQAARRAEAARVLRVAVKVAADYAVDVARRRIALHDHLTGEQ